MKKVRVASLLIILALITGLSWQVTRAQLSGQYFSETGHWVSGEFLSAYYRVPDPERVYGNPITRQFQDSSTGLWVQYFEKTRFELHPEAPRDQRVQLAPIGQILYETGQGALLIEESGDCKVFPETGYRVCHAFLDFYQVYGGSNQFGLPISDFELLNNRIVQYFEKARLEWRPELPRGERVVVGNLGLELFFLLKVEAGNMAPEQGDIIDGAKRLKVRAYPHNAVTGPVAEQTVYIIVQDQRLFPVEKATVSLTVQYPSGKEVNLVAGSTDEYGITQVSFKVKPNSTGMTVIKVKVTYKNPDEYLEGKTVTSFRIWR